MKRLKLQAKGSAWPHAEVLRFRAT